MRKTRREVLCEAPAPGTAGEGDPLEALLEDERARVVRAAVLRLAPLHREVVLLADLEELDLASVAEIVGAGVRPWSPGGGCAGRSRWRWRSPP